jgi:hypothetical protein
MTVTDTTQTHLVTSHGADFFGEDRYTLKQLHEIGQYLRGYASANDFEPLARVLESAGARPQSIPPVKASEYAGLLRRVARGKFTPKKLAGAAALLADAADRAAADREPWNWNPATG